MTDEKKPGRPALREIYCLEAGVPTSKGRFGHGERVKLPKEEAEKLISEGKAQNG